MSGSTLLFGLLPLIMFVIVDSFAGIRTGVIAGVLFALAELIYTLVVFKTIDEVTIASTFLILLFGFMSFKSKKDIYFKLQPVVLGFSFAAVLFVMQLMGKPLLVMMIEKYQNLFPDDMKEALLNPESLLVMARLSWILGIGFIIHALLVGYAAFRMNKWWWLIIRGIGFYLMLLICTLVARFTM